MILTDTHIHLYAEEFDADRTDLIKQAMDENVSRFFIPNIDSSSIDILKKVVDQNPETCFAMMGLHPCYVKGNYLEELRKIENELSKNNYVAVGEIGIDLYWDKTFIKQQEDAFEKQIKWASEINLPIVIHSRNSTNEIITILEKNAHLKNFGIFHCFSGTLEQAQKIISIGFYLGIGGVVTFKNSGMDKVVEQLDLQHIVLETDAPYLAPVPHRGKRNIPEYLKLIAKKVADIKNCSLQEVADVTTTNSKTIFGR